MRIQHQREVVFALGIIVCAGLWRVFAFDDMAAFADGVLLAGVAVFSLAAFGYARVRSHVFHTSDVVHPPMAVAGISILVAVMIRQWWQYTQGDTIAYAEIATDLTDILMRYGIIQVTLWILGWSYLLVAVWPVIAYRAWYSAHKYELWGLSGFVVLAIILRWWKLGAIPNIINGDEGLIGMWAVQLLTQTGTLGHVFVNMDGVGTNYLLVMKGVIALFGRTEFAIRFIPAVFGTIAIVTNYIFARTLFGVRIALITAALVTSAHVHVHFSRTVAVSYTYATAFVPLLLWSMWMVVHARRSWAVVVAALALSLHINMYVDAWAWSVLVLLIVVAWSVIDHQTILQHIPRIVQMLVLMVIGMAPMLIWGIYYPGDFFARLSTDGSFVSGWLAREAAARQTAPVWIIVELYQYAFSTFFTTPFEDFYHARVPILDWLSACFFVVGLVLSHNRLHTWRMILVLGWFWGGMTALAVFTIPVSTYPYRLFVILPVMMLIIAIGIDWVARFFQTQRIIHVVICGIVICIMGMNITIYQTQLASVCRYGGDQKTEQAGTLARVVMHAQMSGERVVVLGSQPDGFYVGPWRSLQYLNPTVQFSNIEESTDFDAEIAQGAVWLVAIPERLADLTQYQVQYAQAEAVIPLLQCDEPLLYMLKIPQS